MEETLISKFIENFKTTPSFIVRAPGRVNIIGKSLDVMFQRQKMLHKILGEHIDYNGYGVFPMAICQSIFCAVKIDETNHTLSIGNIDAKFECENFVLFCIFEQENLVFRSADIDLSDFKIKDDNSSSKAPLWYKYFLCGYKGMLDYLTENGEIFGSTRRKCGKIEA